MYQNVTHLFLTAIFKCMKTISHRSAPQGTEGINGLCGVLCDLCGYSSI